MVEKNVSCMTLPESNKFLPCKCKSTIFRLLFSIKSTIVLGTFYDHFDFQVLFAERSNSNFLKIIGFCELSPEP